MSNNTNKKTRFIVTWFNNERSKLSFANQIRLVKIWTDICIGDEEYEMAAVLQSEKKKLVANHIANKRKNRTWKENFPYPLGHIVENFLDCLSLNLVL